MLFLKMANICINQSSKGNFILLSSIQLSFLTFKSLQCIQSPPIQRFYRYGLITRIYCKTNFKQISSLRHLKLPKSCKITQPSQLTTSFIQIPLPFDKKLLIGLWTRLLILLEKKKQIDKGANIYSRVRKIMVPLPTLLSIL